jgi:hypothetical protein
MPDDLPLLPELSPELKACRAYAAGVREMLAARLGYDLDCVQVTLRPSRETARLFYFEAVIGPWEGAAACHRYEGKTVIGSPSERLRVGKSVRTDLARLVDRLAPLITAEHQPSKRRRPVCSRR